MKLITHLVLGMLISVLLVSGANAVYIGPVQPGYFVTQKTYGDFIGIDDDTGLNFRGAQTSTALFQQFARYGASVNGVGKSGVGGNMNMQTSFIGASIYNLASMLPQPFSNLENFVFYINGHGSSLIVNGLNKILVGTGSNNSKAAITDIELTRYLSYLPSNLNKVVIIDSCYSGGFIDELSSLDNIYIITSASSSSKSYYDFNGVPYMSRAMSEFLTIKNGSGFEVEEMYNYLSDNDTYRKYIGMKGYRLEDEYGYEEPVILTADSFNIQTYQSPKYAPVPEPSSFILASGGLFSLYLFRRRFRA